MQSTGQTSTQALSLTPMHGSVITYVMQRILPAPVPGRRARIEIRIASLGRKGTVAGLFVLATALGGSPLRGQSPPACTGGKTALVLSGGGAKGLAHISVLRAL